MMRMLLPGQIGHSVHQLAGEHLPFIEALEG